MFAPENIANVPSLSGTFSFDVLPRKVANIFSRILVHENMLNPTNLYGPFSVYVLPRKVSNVCAFKHIRSPEEYLMISKILFQEKYQIRPVYIALSRVTCCPNAHSRKRPNPTSSYAPPHLRIHTQTRVNRLTSLPPVFLMNTDEYFESLTRCDKMNDNT